MKNLQIALAQINVSVGALETNMKTIVAATNKAVDAGADVVVFPELALCGYPPEDLVLKEHFLEDCEMYLIQLAQSLPENIVCIVGCPRLLDDKIFNTATIISQGEISDCYQKTSLPNYGVFDEKRIFSPGVKPLIIDVKSKRLALHICEDSWNSDNAPCAALFDENIDFVLNLSASPYRRGKLKKRTDVLSETCKKLKVPLAYCNLVGGQDELVFDGASMLIDATGVVIARAAQFKEDLLLVSSSTQNRIEPLLSDLEETYSALKLGLRDYVTKNGFKEVVVAISGGIDSALVATIATDALGNDKVTGITMPSHFTSSDTLNDAKLLADNLGIHLYSIPISNLFQSYLELLEPLWHNLAEDVTEENLQARIRGNIVMAISNKFGRLALATGNKSELATGYCTLYGDMVGGFAVIKDVPKTLVFELAKWRNSQNSSPVIPVSTIARPPSAELRPDQKDSDSLPPYPVLDAILQRYVEQDKGIDKIISEGFDEQVVKQVVKLVDRNEYKRRQGPPGIRITPKAFGRDRRVPITNLYSHN